jgi:hypothetical protein
MADKIECYYSGSGEGKTTAIIHIIAHVYNTTGKIARVYVGDGSKMTYVESGLVDAGIVQMVDFSMRDYPLTVSQQMCEGFYLQDPQDPMSKLVKSKPEDLAKIGVWVYEGLSVMGAYIMGNTEGGLAARAAKGEKIGQDSPITIVDPSGLKFGGNPMSHYNVAQRQILTNIQRSRAMNGIVLWTAHERFTDSAREEGMDKFIGPDVAGKAMTAWISREFNNTLHFCSVNKPGKMQDQFTGKQAGTIQREYRVYTRDHADPEGLVQVRYRAVNRCPLPEMMPDYLVGEEPGANILEFYRIMAEAKKKWTVDKLIHRPEVGAK